MRTRRISPRMASCHSVYHGNSAAASWLGSMQEPYCGVSSAEPLLGQMPLLPDHMQGQSQRVTLSLNALVSTPIGDRYEERPRRVPPPPASHAVPRASKSRKGLENFKGHRNPNMVLSRGSKNHLAGNCRPCLSFNTPEGCSFGLKCNFCHLEHDTTKLLEASMFSVKKQLKKALVDTEVLSHKSTSASGSPQMSSPERAASTSPLQPSSPRAPHLDGQLLNGICYSL